ncbi:type III secretion protein, HrcV family [Weissella oryzae SG25]|uniref:Type III secretion protein, HrcV family n=1 Tax=Weissella oryzae (strain DSM 25784 / JCM 18191 / LMG 30913 / SG25) TaxID=1329250 RepID=A0A069D372_WEIOS|nr:type III secretion protein, HrcV family [Weissella oryzae SG25]
MQNKRQKIKFLIEKIEKEFGDVINELLNLSDDEQGDEEIVDLIEEIAWKDYYNSPKTIDKYHSHQIALALHLQAVRSVNLSYHGHTQ